MKSNKNHINNSKKDLEKEINNIINENIPIEKKINKIIHATGISCGIIALQPIPIADIFILTPIQAIMVLNIGKIKGFEINIKRA